MSEPKARAAADRVLILPLSLLLFSIVFVPLRILEAEGLPRYMLLRDELTETRAKNQALRHEVRQLQARVTALREDPKAIERLARDELGMLRGDELVFQFGE